MKYLGFYLEKEIRDRFGQRERKALIVFIEFGRKPENSLINKCPEFLHRLPLEFMGILVYKTFLKLMPHYIKREDD